jgi:hypothetical protein
MIEVLRISGLIMMVAGLLLAGSWFIEPLRELWPLLLDLPLPIRIGLIVAGVGLAVVMATVIHDRIRSNPDSIKENLGGDE